MIASCLRHFRKCSISSSKIPLLLLLINCLLLTDKPPIPLPPPHLRLDLERGREGCWTRLEQIVQMNFTSGFERVKISVRIYLPPPCHFESKNVERILLLNTCTFCYFFFLPPKNKNVVKLGADFWKTWFLYATFTCWENYEFFFVSLCVHAYLVDLVNHKYYPLISVLNNYVCYFSLFKKFDVRGLFFSSGFIIQIRDKLILFSFTQKLLKLFHGSFGIRNLSHLDKWLSVIFFYYLYIRNMSLNQIKEPGELFSTRIWERILVDFCVAYNKNILYCLRFRKYYLFYMYFTENGLDSLENIR